MERLGPPPGFGELGSRPDVPPPVGSMGAVPLSAVPGRAAGDGAGRLRDRLEWSARAIGVGLALLGVVVLVGWASGVEALKRVRPPAVPMSPMTAVGLILAGSSLCLNAVGRRRRLLRWAARALAAAVFLLGAVRELDYAFGRVMGIDRLLFASRQDGLHGQGMSRIAPNTALAFLLAGAALLTIESRRRRWYRSAQLLAMLLGLLALAALLVYLYDVTEMGGLAYLIPMAVHTAAGFALLSLGILFSRPDRGLMAIVTSETQAGLLARRLLPATVIVPALLGGLLLLGRRRNLVPAELGTSLTAVATVLFFGAMVLWIARQLYNTESERREALDALTESEAFYHYLVESLPQNILRKDVLGRFTFANQRCCRVFGWPLDQLQGRTDFDLFPPELAEKYRRDDLEVMDSGVPLEVVEEHVTPDHEVHYVQVIKTALSNAEGEVIGVQGIFWDVTERKRIDEELRKSRERFEVAVRGSKDGLWDWDIRTDQVYFSPRWKSMIGFEDHEIANHFDQWESRIHPDDHGRAMETVQRYLRGETPEYQLEHRLRHKDGSYRWILARGVALRDDGGRPFRMAGSHTDITARKEAERQLSEQNRRLQELAESERQALDELKSTQSRMVQTAKLAGLGQMVAGVAHEINNPLSYVGNNVAVLQRDLAELVELLELYRSADGLLAERRPELHARIAELCERIDIDYTLTNLGGLLGRTRDGLRRIQQIVKDLRVFARLDESELDEVDLNHGVESTVTIIQGHAKKKGVRIELELAPLPAVSCFPAKINQVLMNLISNAIDACAADGRVVVRTRPEDGGAGVRIEIEDDGEGIDPAVRERIFDPFFTTKPVGIGTGLGLSISYGIVQDHGGRIEVESAPGRGARFTIHLPTRIPHRDGRPATPAAVATENPA